MQAELRQLISPDTPDLERYRPDNEAFAISVQAIVGPNGAEGEESFDFTICTPEWIRQRYGDEIIIGLHHLIVPSYDHAKIAAFIEKFVSTCFGDNWTEVARKLTRLGSWEFEDYRP